MIDYKEMEKVIQDLNNYVSKVQKMSETQQKLDGTIAEISILKNDVLEIGNTISKYTKTIDSLESEHKDIRANFETVLQDYKKLHSAFELLNIELKKINTQNENNANAISELNSLSQKANHGIEVIVKSQEENAGQQQTYYNELTNQFQKTHQGIELLNIELKKINTQNENNANAISELNSLSQKANHGIEEIAKSQEENAGQQQTYYNELTNQFQKTHQGIEIVEKKQEESINSQQQSFKKVNIWLGILTGMMGVGIVLSILHFFI